ASAAGLALIAFARRRWTKIAGGAAMIVPHAVGAPQATTTAIYVPAQLAAEFAVVSLLVSAMFWVALGFLSGYFLKRQDSSEARS
ncbi:MAG: cobalt transporter, partial [Alphaproteobacteria bacterium]|nr:cobalt transporter [Alphaproteobacteria bacterium]